MTMANTERPGGGARAQIRDVKDQVIEQAKGTFYRARDRAGSSLGESKGQLAEQFGTVAEALRRTTEHLRSEDQQRIAGFTESVAGQLDQIAGYLRNRDAQAIRQDLENLARRQPTAVLGGALALGVIAARFLKSSQRNRAGQRLSDGGRHGRERRFGYTGYNQPYIEESETTRHLGMETPTGGGYAGA